MTCIDGCFPRRCSCVWLAVGFQVKANANSKRTWRRFLTLITQSVTLGSDNEAGTAKSPRSCDLHDCSTISCSEFPGKPQRRCLFDQVSLADVTPGQDDFSRKQKPEKQRTESKVFLTYFCACGVFPTGRRRWVKMRRRGEQREDSSTLIAMETSPENNYGSITPVLVFHPWRIKS